MSNGILSQEEIDALLKGGSLGAPTDNPSSAPGGLLTDIQRDTLGEIGNISMGTAATTLSTLLGKRVSITTPRVTETTRSQLQSEYPLPYVVVDVGYTSGLEGNNLLVIKKSDVGIIVDLMMGGDGTNPPEELSELHLSAIGEAMNQMMGSATTSMSTMFGRRIEIAPPKINLVDFAENELNEKLGEQFEPLVQVAFRMEIENLLDSEIMQIIPLVYAKEMVNSLLGGNTTETQTSAVASVPVQTKTAPSEKVAAVSAQAPFQGQARAVSFPQDTPIGHPDVAVQPAQFMPLNQIGGSNQVGNLVNIDLIMDVPLQITVELGKTRKTIKEILEFGPGAIIQLDKLAGEPVDLLVNGKLIAKGEVVVIDENYGVRVTAIISPFERMPNLQ
ncbi:MAG: flagellar motor switch phosphatase FliY [Firmicutes bacterium]|nr:flagellar motor switch phosphatase FliY [Bacillota bacterium]